MDVIGALISIHSLKVNRMPHNMILLSNAVPSHHLPCIPRYLNGLHAVIPLQHGNHLNSKLSFLAQP